MAQRAKTIDLLRVVDLLQEHITPALCRTVFGAVRKTERQRVWTLEALIRFWTAVVLRAPKALSQALADSLEGRDPTYPRIEASPEAFFQRCRDLRPAFFAEVFQRFTIRLVTAVPPRYAAEVAPGRARFTAAAGSTGSFVAQIAKLKGCRVIGIAGGEKKCTLLTKDLSLDGAIDHRREDVPARLRELCPNGINVYFDNVGGEILDAALGNLAAGARIVVCGAISGYNELTHMPPIRNYLNLVLAGATMRGFLVLTFAPRFGEAIAQLASWAVAGQVRTQVDIMEGLERAPEALRRLFTGENIGKQLVKIADAP